MDNQEKPILYCTLCNQEINVYEYYDTGGMHWGCYYDKLREEEAF